MDKNQKCDEMVSLVLRIEKVKKEKSAAMKEFNDDIAGLENLLSEIARENTDQMELGLDKQEEHPDEPKPKKSSKGSKKVAH